MFQEEGGGGAAFGVGDEIGGRWRKAARGEKGPRFKLCWTSREMFGIGLRERKNGFGSRTVLRT